MVTLDNGRVKYAFQRAPAVFADEIDHWFNKERLSFLGARRNAKGGIKGKLLHKERWGRGGGWSPSIVGQFTSSKTYQGQIDASMSMGFAPGSKLEDAMELLEKGGTISSSKFMPIPVWENLQKAGVMTNQDVRSSVKESAHHAFKEMSEGNSLFSIPGRGGTILWLSKVFGDWNSRSRRPLLLFIGKKSIRVRKQFDFTRTWLKRYPKVMRRGEMSIYRATRKVEALIKQGKLGLF
jgi:hypothetical protein